MKLCIFIDKHVCRNRLVIDLTLKNITKYKHD